MKKAIHAMADEIKKMKFKSVAFPSSYRCDLSSIVNGGQTYRRKEATDISDCECDDEAFNLQDENSENNRCSNLEIDDFDSSDYIDDWEREVTKYF